MSADQCRRGNWSAPQFPYITSDSYIVRLIRIAIRVTKVTNILDSAPIRNHYLLGSIGQNRGALTFQLVEVMICLGSCLALLGIAVHNYDFS